MADGTDVDDGPSVNATYFLGYFREDYEYNDHVGQDEYLDEHNGRFCITPEYPTGIYAYFCTVDENWNSVYPYAVGPTFYGNYASAAVSSIPGGTTVYTAPTAIAQNNFADADFSIYPNPVADLIAIQVNGLVGDQLKVELIDVSGRLVRQTIINAGQTIAHFNTQTLYAGIYFVRITDRNKLHSKKIEIQRK